MLEILQNSKCRSCGVSSRDDGNRFCFWQHGENGNASLWSSTSSSRGVWFQCDSHLSGTSGILITYSFDMLINLWLLTVYPYCNTNSFVRTAPHHIENILILFCWTIYCENTAAEHVRWRNIFYCLLSRVYSIQSWSGIFNRLQQCDHYYALYCKWKIHALPLNFIVIKWNWYAAHKIRFEAEKKVLYDFRT